MVTKTTLTTMTMTAMSVTTTTSTAQTMMRATMTMMEIFDDVVYLDVDNNLLYAFSDGIISVVIVAVVGCGLRVVAELFTGRMERQVVNGGVTILLEFGRSGRVSTSGFKDFY